MIGAGGGAGFRGDTGRILAKPQGIEAIAAEYGVGISKGLTEPCSPYREAYFFGAPFGDIPDASNWNCLPELVGATVTFDLSAMEPNHEVAVALFCAYNIYTQVTMRHKWYRDRDGKLLLEYSYTIPNPEDYGYPSWAWSYMYSYIGYVDPAIYGDIEINENGAYHVVSTAETFSMTINFSVTGISEGYQTVEREIVLVEGNNELNISLVPL